MSSYTYTLTVATYQGHKVVGTGLSVEALQLLMNQWEGRCTDMFYNKE